MNKKVLIIANPGQKGTENYCEGVNKDVDNYKRYFMSATGGNWYEDEIEVLVQPTRTVMELKMLEMSLMEFSVVVFVGHGYSIGDETYLELNPGSGTFNDMSVEQLKNPRQKRIIIIDCCRKPLETYLEHVEFYNMVKAGVSSIGDKTRRVYEELISKMPIMNIVMYSCDLNETAGDNSRKGGYYSSSLLEVCYKFARDNNCIGRTEYLSAVEAHNRTVPMVQSKKIDQNPQVEKPRSEPYLPFAVVKGSIFGC